MQSGGTNQATVQQSAGPGGNDVGKPGAPVTQVGNGNRFLETQSTGGGFSRGDNDIVAMAQSGDNNFVHSDYSNNAGSNRITSLLQSGNGNWVSIGRNASIGGVITTLNQIGSANSAQVGQTGSNNTVVLLQQLGDGNGGPFGSGGPQNPNGWGVSIGQDGNDNLINEASITGSNNNINTLGTLSPSAGAISITQHGNNNGRVMSVARIVGSNGNAIFVNEQGNYNNFSIIQGISTASTGNLATLNQLGSYNSAIATQYGSQNHLNIKQLSDSNSVVANFTGDSNGNGSLTGIAAALLPSNANLAEGTIYQDSTGSAYGNSVTYNVTGSSNLFAMAQIGGNNSIVGTVGSSGNQVAVLQKGLSNVTNFVQTGGNNNAISVSQ